MKKNKNKTITLMAEINKKLIPTLLLSVKWKIFLLITTLRLLKIPIASRP